MDYKKKYESWLSEKNIDSEILQELIAMKNDETTIENSFYKNLSFGTGGLRGVIGAGTNNMNIYTVAKASKGFAKYLLESFKNPSCAVAYDSRNKSDLFARISAATLAGMGISVHLYKELMPTPMLSYAVRALQCNGGIVITASHNPAKYNGYKVYGSDGCQITLEAAKIISGYMDKEKEFSDEKYDFEELLNSGKINYIDENVINSYYEEVMSLSLQKPQARLNVVYSPLNGAGNKPVRNILQKLGNINIEVVEEQEHPDGNFSTCPYPNPEIKEAMALSINKMQETNADFCIATDPDCDRVGVAVPTQDGYYMINGNEMGVMLLEYICKQKSKNNTMPNKPLAVKTIVTTQLASEVCKKYDVELINVLTGFKFIGEQIGMLEQIGEEKRFVFGFEESYGYLAGSFVRDKDAVIASMLICEMASYYKKQNKTLFQVLNEMYCEYGYYKNELMTFEFEGASGMVKMNAIIDDLRNTQSIGEYKINNKIDYLNDETGLPKSNVLTFDLQDKSQIIVRPSGTEPKLKIYLTAVGETLIKAGESTVKLSEECNKLIQNL